MTPIASRKALLGLSAAVVLAVAAPAFATDTAAPSAVTPAQAAAPRPVADTPAATASPQTPPSQLRGFASGDGQSLGPMQVNPLLGGPRPMQGTGGGK